MRYLALATDYDGTLAADGAVAEETVRALENLKASGRRLLLVTGRHLRDLQLTFAKLELFDRVVAENGAVLYAPATREEKVLAEAPKDEFLEALRVEKVKFEVGRAIVSSWTPAETTIIEVDRAADGHGTRETLEISLWIDQTRAAGCKRRGKGSELTAELGNKFDGSPTCGATKRFCRTSASNTGDTSENGAAALAGDR